MPTFPKILEKKLARPVAILGAGVSGNAVKKFLAGLGIESALYDAGGLAGTIPQFGDAEAATHDLCIYSPGFAQNHPWMQAARRAGALCLTEIDFAAVFLQGSAAPLKRLADENAEAFIARAQRRFSLVAITGTNGKTTLTEFLSFAHKKAGRDSAAVGNNGIPMTTLLDADASSGALPICEVSSFQAEDLHYFSPRAVLWTNFDEDHINRHGSLEKYFRAKFRLIEQQESLRLLIGDFPDRADPALREILALRICIVGESVAEAAKKFGIALPPHTQIATRAEVRENVPAGSIFETFPQMENYALARRYWLACGLPLRELENAALAFKPCAHRLTKVAETGNAPEIEFWNDSKGTNFHSVMAALASFRDLPIYWIGGGQSKGGDINNFVNNVAVQVKEAFLIGETAAEMNAQFLQQNVPSTICTSLGTAVLSAFKAAAKSQGGRAIVLFSPGFASFDMFKSYSDRGAQFVQIVNNICEKV